MNTLKFGAEELYNKELKKIEKQIGTGVTYGSELAKLAKKMFGSKFKGVYAADEIEKLKKENGYFIFNLDKRDEPGSHWLGLAKSPKGILVYDSFARSTKEIAPNIYSLGNQKNGRGPIIRDTEDDAEQLITEDNCGARTLAWLKVYDDHGPEVASWI